MRDTDIMFWYMLTVFVVAIVVLWLKNYNTEYVNYYPYAIVYQKWEAMHITTFTSETRDHISLKDWFVYFWEYKIDKTEWATEILNVEAMQPIISKK